MSKVFKLATVLVFASAVIAVALPSQAAQPPTVTGTWKMAVESPAGTGNPTFTMVQKGEEVTGTYKGQLGEAPISGTIKGNEISFSFKVSVQGQDLKIDYIGVVEGDKMDKMKGKVVFGEFGEGTFTGAKENPQQ